MSKVPRADTQVFWGHPSPLELHQLPQGALRRECAEGTGHGGSSSLIMIGNEGFARQRFEGRIL